MSLKLLYLAQIGLLAFGLSACAATNDFFAALDFDSKAENADEKKLPASIAVSRYTSSSLWNYKMGRDFAAAGRYELAKEHYLLALASANTPELQYALSAELQSIDQMIKTLR